MVMASGCILPFAFLSSNTIKGPHSWLPNYTNFSKGRISERHRCLKMVVFAESSGGGCCGGSSSSSSSGGSCSSHGKSSVPDLSKIGKEFETMVARATLSEREKEYNTVEMKGNITRDDFKEVMNIGPSRFAEEGKGETVIDLQAMLNELKNDNFAFDNPEDVFI
uniref:Uncharacterized protein n=1 Tax=Picea sitchensis TaxID=3332 RepID=A9NMZ4_PICSI|nr:unknown [Picea sitchensis]